MKKVTLHYDRDYSNDFYNICKRYGWTHGYPHDHSYFTPYVVRNDENEIVGFCNSTGLDVDYYVCLYGLYIKPEFRHQGYGEAMLRALIKMFSYADKIYWYCKEDNWQAQRLYNKYATIYTGWLGNSDHPGQRIYIANKEEV